jgi:hypothetical protein
MYSEPQNHRYVESALKLQSTFRCIQSLTIIDTLKVLQSCNPRFDVFRASESSIRWKCSIVWCRRWYKGYKPMERVLTRNSTMRYHFELGSIKLWTWNFRMFFFYFLFISIYWIFDFYITSPWNIKSRGLCTVSIIHLNVESAMKLQTTFRCIQSLTIIDTLKVLQSCNPRFDVFRASESSIRWKCSIVWCRRWDKGYKPMERDLSRMSTMRSHFELGNLNFELWIFECFLILFFLYLNLLESSTFISQVHGISKAEAYAQCQ